MFNKGTIKENIAFGCEKEVDMERIVEVAKMANAHDFISSFEKGYETYVGERGISLSGGQKQSIYLKLYRLEIISSNYSFSSRSF